MLLLLKEPHNFFSPCIGPDSEFKVSKCWIIWKKKIEQNESINYCLKTTPILPIDSSSGAFFTRAFLWGLIHICWTFPLRTIDQKKDIEMDKIEQLTNSFKRRLTKSVSEWQLKLRLLFFPWDSLEWFLYNSFLEKKLSFWNRVLETGMVFRLPMFK